MSGRWELQSCRRLPLTMWYYRCDWRRRCRCSDRCRTDHRGLPVDILDTTESRATEHLSSHSWPGMTHKSTRRPASEPLRRQPQCSELHLIGPPDWPRFACYHCVAPERMG